MNLDRHRYSYIMSRLFETARMSINSSHLARSIRLTHLSFDSRPSFTFQCLVSTRRVFDIDFEIEAVSSLSTRSIAGEVCN